MTLERVLGVFFTLPGQKNWNTSSGLWSDLHQLHLHFWIQLCCHVHAEGTFVALNHTQKCEEIGGIKKHHQQFQWQRFGGTLIQTHKLHIAHRRTHAVEFQVLPIQILFLPWNEISCKPFYLVNLHEAQARSQESSWRDHFITHTSELSTQPEGLAPCRFKCSSYVLWNGCCATCQRQIFWTTGNWIPWSEVNDITALIPVIFINLWVPDWADRNPAGWKSITPLLQVLGRPPVGLTVVVVQACFQISLSRIAAPLKHKKKKRQDLSNHVPLFLETDLDNGHSGRPQLFFVNKVGCFDKVEWLLFLFWRN